jgi:hypothetical protein
MRGWIPFIIIPYQGLSIMSHLASLRFWSVPCNVRSPLWLKVCLQIMGISLSTIQLRRPPVIRLIDSTIHKSLDSSHPPEPKSEPSPPKKIESDLFSTLSLSSKPIVQPKPKQQPPVFGMPSLIGSTPAPHQPPKDPNEMDWSPTNSDAASAAKSIPADTDTSWLRPQRFFAPENPTGLEELFDRTRIIEDVQMADASVARESTSPWRLISSQRGFSSWWWVCAIIPLLGAAVYKLWQLRQSALARANSFPQPVAQVYYM